MRQILCIFFGIFLLSSLWGQEEDLPKSATLPIAEVTDNLLRYVPTGERSEQWDSTALSQFGGSSVAELLEQESGAFIKSYGNGALATIALRGASAGHTTVLWNGLPIQSPMLGLLDFALLPLNLVDEVHLHYGGNTAGWGSGAIGGVVALENKQNSRRGLSLFAQSLWGSFGRSDQELKLQYGGKKWGVSTRLFQQKAINNFTYIIPANQTTKEQTHAAYLQRGALQEFYFKPTDNQSLNLYLWWQKMDRELPPTTVQSRSHAIQEDDFVRSLLHWKKTDDRVIWQGRLGWFKEAQHYQDSLNLIDAQNDFSILTAEGEGQWYLNAQQRFQVGVNHTFFQAEASAYGQRRIQNRTALFATFRQHIPKGEIQLSVRQTLVDGSFVPFVPNLGVSRQLGKHLHIQAKLSRNYRLPTLNDLYWNPGGNRDLLPERGWSQELTLSTQQVLKKQQWNYSITGFNRQIKNWILWALPAGQNFYVPSNLTKVWSRGMEQRLAWSWQEGQWKGQISGGYDLVLSTNQIAIKNPEIDAGDQLVYVPRHRVFGKIVFNFKQINLIYRHNYVSSVNTLNNIVLEPYQLANVSLNYTWKRAWWDSQIFLQINNLYNKNYRVIERRAMPGRNFQVGLKIEIGSRAKIK